MLTIQGPKKKARFLRLRVGLLGTLFLGACAATEPGSPPHPASDDIAIDRTAAFADVLSYRGEPEASEDWSFGVFADQGSWAGFALLPEESPRLGFSGPFLMTRGRWAGKRIELTLQDEDASAPIDLRNATSRRAVTWPGALETTAVFDDLEVTLELWFEVSGTTLIRAKIHNTGSSPRHLTAGWSLAQHVDQGVPETHPLSSRLEIYHPDYEDRVHMDFPPSVTLSVEPETVTDKAAPSTETASKPGPASVWHLHAAEPSRTLEPGGSLSTGLALDLQVGDDPAPEFGRRFLAEGADWQGRRDAAQGRWNGYLDAVLERALPRRSADLLAVKSVQTLRGNLRRPAGRIGHQGIFPSSNIWYFNGFWAWDSWKHAVATALFDVESAQEQVRLMFDFQDEHGMIADVVYLDASEDNWRDTKPPLAGWAVEEIHRRSGNRDADMEFVRELYPKLVAYHRFWYADRDHDQDGLCEYGSTDGTLAAARWESGMDNAVRFDHTQMLKNNDHAWSMDQESVDLNSYLYRDKLALAYLADVLQLEDESAEWTRQAEELGRRIRETFYDEASGWFYDINLETGEPVPSREQAVQSPEGWIPLWTGVASPEQAAEVRRGLLDPARFRTHVPFPTVSKADPEYSDGYWRGLVWIDQAYFAIEGLRRYGFDEDADALRDQLFTNLEGALTPGAPLRENYHPETGAGHNANHFSWTAAHLLLLTQEPAQPNGSGTP